MNTYRSGMNSHFFWIIIALLATAVLSPASAQVYTWEDKNGRIVISDNPPPGSEKRIERSGEERVFRAAPHRETAPDPAPDERTRSAPAGEEHRSRQVRDVHVIMYKTSWCGYCKKARDYVTSLGATLTEYDIELQPQKQEEMLRKSGGSRGIPLIDVEGVIIRGFNPPAIKAAIDERMRS